VPEQHIFLPEPERPVRNFTKSLPGFWVCFVTGLSGSSGRMCKGYVYCFQSDCINRDGMLNAMDGVFGAMKAIYVPLTHPAT